MNVSRGLEHYAAPASGVTLTIGNFDGVHCGHQELIRVTRRVAEQQGTPAVAMTFDPHPLEILVPERAPGRLVTIEEKLALLERAGIDQVIVLPATRALLGRSPEDFVEQLVQACRPRALVEGPDFNFGRGRAGSVETLRALASRFAYEVHEIDVARCVDLDGAPSVHSSAIRAALAEGRVDIAAAMLGRHYRICGVVGSGAGRGAGLGFPTANLERIPHLLPGEAVYAAVAQLPDDVLRLAAVNVGQPPTFDQHTLRVEAFILDWDVPLGGQQLGLHFLERLRGQVRFNGPDELIAQLNRDVAATRAHATEVARLQAERPLDLPPVR